MPPTHADRRQIRHRRLRARLRGSADRPRLSVFRSARHLVVQLVDDAASRTLLGLTDASQGVSAQRPSASQGEKTAGVARAFALGKLLAERARAQGMTRAVFDRGGYAYHGQVKAVADGAREGGLEL